MLRKHEGKRRERRERGERGERRKRGERGERRGEEGGERGRREGESREGEREACFLINFIINQDLFLLLFTHLHCLLECCAWASASTYMLKNI
jgi:hypothetical protein